MNDIYDTRGRTKVTTEKFDLLGNMVSKSIKIDGVPVFEQESGPFTRPAVEGIIY